MTWTHIDDDIPYSFNWSLSPDGSMLAVAKKDGPSSAARNSSPDALATIQRNQSGCVVGNFFSHWSADGKNLWVRASTTTGTNGLLNVDLQGRVRPVWEQTKMGCRVGDSLARWALSGAVAGRQQCERLDDRELLKGGRWPRIQNITDSHGSGRGKNKDQKEKGLDP